MENNWDASSVRQWLISMMEQICKAVFPVDEILHKIKVLYNNFGPGLHYRKPEILAPLVSYFVLKKKGINIGEAVICGVSELEQRDLKTFKIQMRNYASTQLKNLKAEVLGDTIDG